MTRISTGGFAFGAATAPSAIAAPQRAPAPAPVEAGQAPSDRQGIAELRREEVLRASMRQLAQGRPDSRPEGQAPGAAPGPRTAEALAGYAGAVPNIGSDTMSMRIGQLISFRDQTPPPPETGTYEAAAGQLVAVQLEAGTDWTSSWDGTALVLDTSQGQIRIEGADRSAAVGVMVLGSGAPQVIYMAPVLDRMV